MIDLKGYYKGRDKTYASELTDEIKANALVTVDRIKKLMLMFYADNLKAYDRGFNSGWRPQAVNSGTVGSAKKSKHLLALAGDVSDDDEALDKWCMSPKGLLALSECELWMEHPSATPRWCHLQTVPPKSGNRVFYP